MKKFYSALAGVLLILTVFITAATAEEGADLGLSVSFTADGQSTEFFTTARNVEAFIATMGIFIGEMDLISPALTTEITQGMEIEIIRAFPVYIVIDDHESYITFLARPGSILSSLVNDFRAATGLDFTFDRASWHRRLAPGDVVELSSVVRFQQQIFEEIAYETEYVETDELYIGEVKVYRQGVYGMRLIDTLSTYVGGRENGQPEELANEVLTAPINAIVHVGTALPPGHARAASGEVFTYHRAVTMEATAYTLSFACTGRHPDHPLFGRTASGMMAQVGIVAVDTNVIPFHTRLYIEGYGFAVAGDRGGAIRGYKVDLFFDTMDEVRQFGRRHLRVWILDEI